jgi:hypothetical protein
MNSIYLIIVLSTLASPMAFAQRPDGCPVEETAFLAVNSVPTSAVSQILEESGVGVSQAALTFALGDSRAYVRSLAAERLAAVAGSSALGALTRAWQVEKDRCTKFLMEVRLGSTLGAHAVDPKLRPSGLEWIRPFEPCTQSEHAPVALILEPPSGTKATVEVYARNETEELLPFLMAPPQRLFSATVLDPSGGHAQIAKGRDEMYKPLTMTNGPVFLALPSHELTHIWTWYVGEDFDMSAPGTYHVSLGGRVGYLDATICSNTVEVRVEM